MIMRAPYGRLGLLGMVLVLLAGCATLATPPQLPPEENALYRVYSRLMTPHQLREYLARPSAAARAAYAQELGVAQRLFALPEAERQAVLRGRPFVGMSKQALLLLWGEPYLREGPAWDERWYYLGDYFSLMDVGYAGLRMDTVMEVALVDGRIQWWQERVPTEENRLPFQRRFLNRPGD